MNNSATIIALAWPDTKVIKEGKWYDFPMQWIGVVKNGYYKAGHAAFLLINNDNGHIEYFDYGRYHTPIKYGRVRDRYTDPDIEIKLKAQIENGVILNLKEILLNRYNNKSCHGEGRLTASIVKGIDFNKAYSYAKELQNREAINYGPFELNGSTCSRMVVQVVFKSTSNWLTKLLIMFPYTISATPRSNNKILNDCRYYYEINHDEIKMKSNRFYFFKRLFERKSNEKIRIPENIAIEYS